MTRPISVTVTEGAGYIRYSENASVRTIDIVESCSVAADIDADGAVVGVEILDVACDDQVTIARGFAADHLLAFPRDVSGALVPA